MANKPVPEHYLGLSGGIDSAWCAHHYLSQGIPLWLHHVRLADWEGRQDVEDEAVKAILRWINRKGWMHLVTYTRSEVDFGTLRWIPKNFHLWAYFAGAVMASPKGRSIRSVVIPRHSDAFTSEAGAQASNEAYLTHIKTIAKREPVLEFPMVHMTKAQVVQDIPADLLALTWWCRTPKAGKPCHQCMTCKQVDPALEARAQSRVGQALVG